MTEVPTTSDDANVGLVLGGKYELLRLLGKGGMGAVYEGRNQIGKRVAVKLLLDPSFVANSELATRFFREAQASAAVESKHVVDVYDTGIDPPTGYPFIIMAFLAGEDLEHVLRREGALNPNAAARIVSQAASGIAKAHVAGIVHRDIKPANLFLAREDNEYTVKVLDFGIAKVDAQRFGDARGITHTGALLGTPLYMSPEQAQGLKTVDARTDVWSLGMCLYHALAGRMPFEDVDTIGKLIVAIVTRDLTPLTTLAPWVSPELAALVHRALLRDPDQRLASAHDLVVALQPFTGGSNAITASQLTGVNAALDATLAPGADAPHVTPPSSPSSAARAVEPPSGARTTGGVANEGAPPASARPRAAMWGGLAIAVVAAALVTAFTLKERTHEPATTQASTSATQSPPPTTATTTTPPKVDDAIKRAVLTLKMPSGFTVTVDGKAPGPGNAEAPSPVENGALELRGEFQQKFLVAVHDKSGARVLMQDVYMYSDRLDPETIDTKVGAVKVDKPKRETTSTTAPSSASAAPTTKSSAELPARF